MYLQKIYVCQTIGICIISLEAVEDIINNNSADGGKYPSYIQLYARKNKLKKKKKEEEERVK